MWIAGSNIGTGGPQFAWRGGGGAREAEEGEEED